MAVIQTDRTTALNWLLFRLQPDSAPVLTHDGSLDPTLDEVGYLLDQFKRVSVWTAVLTVAPGTRIVPDPQNGRAYICGQNADGTAGGITGATAPTYWPLWARWPGSGWYAGGWPLYGSSEYPSVVDGTVTWYEDGPQPLSLWDLRGAAYEGWTSLKAGKIAGTVGGRAGKMGLSSSSLRDGCLAMARQYAPVGFG